MNPCKAYIVRLTVRDPLFEDSEGPRYGEGIDSYTEDVGSFML